MSKTIQQTTADKATKSAVRGLAKMERSLSKMDPASAAFWRSSATYQFLKNGVAGRVVVLVAE